MNPGRSSLELGGPSEYYAPPTDRGRLGSRIGRLWAREASGFLENDLNEEFSDSYKVSGVVQAFMGSLYDDERYAKHNARLLSYYAHYADREDISEEDHATIEINRMAIELHDMVDHGILNAEKTAAKLGREPKQAADIRSNALASFNEILNQVGDQDGSIKAYLFAIDASKWESAARIWRQSANERIEELIADDKMQPYSAKIVKAAVNKTEDLLDSVGTEELTRVLKDNVLVDLKLGAISEGTLNHNIQGLFLKALETLDIIEHPPKDNPASTWRDCTEAINFFVPALATLGYKELAMDLRSSALKWLVDDPHGDAERQHAASEQYFDQLKEMVIDLQEKAFGDVEVATECRVKTEGSIRAKLASKDYVELHGRAYRWGLPYYSQAPE
jgi:hypothetical protein